MNKLRWVTIFAVLALCCTLSYADSTLPDGNIGGKSGGKSTTITSLNSTFNFQACPPGPQPYTGSNLTDLQIDCNLFGGAQAVFGGINGTSLPWNSLAVNFEGYNPNADPNVNCFGGTLFQNCVLSQSDCTGAGALESCTLTAQFTQGNANGIQCVPFNGSGCAINSTLNYLYDLAHPGASRPYLWPAGGSSASPTCAGPVPGAVCGSSEFVIGVGFGTDGNGNLVNGFNDLLDLDASASANAPEPQTILLVGGAMISMLMLGLKKARLV